MILDHPVLSQRLFFPRRVALPRAEIVRSGGVDLACYRAGRERDRPTLVYFHGNGEVVADHIPGLVATLGLLGVNVFMAEYRGYGASGGTPSLAVMLDDVRAVFEAVDAPEERVVAFGRSIGSIYAIELVHRHPGVAGLVLDSGIADVLDRILVRVRPAELGVSRAELEQAVSERFDHRAKLGGYRGHVLLLHTRADDVVPLTHAELNLAWAGGYDKGLVVFPAGDHASIFPANEKAYLGALGRFLDACGPRRG